MSLLSEITFDLPMLWLLLGTAFIFMLVMIANDRNCRKLSFTRFIKERDPNRTTILSVAPMLIVRSFFVRRRKIPSGKDCCRASSDEVPLFLVVR